MHLIHRLPAVGTTQSVSGRIDVKRRLNRISFADLRFPLAGTRSMRVEKKNVVMEKATACFDKLSKHDKLSKQLRQAEQPLSYLRYGEQGFGIV